MKTLRPDDNTKNEERPPAKRRRMTKAVKSSRLLNLPTELMLRVVSYVGSSSDRLSIQTTCKTLKQVSDRDEILHKLDLVGDLKTGAGSVLGPYKNNLSKAISKLREFALLRNLDALYLLGMMATYCSDVPTSAASGAAFFSVGTKLGCPRCAYEGSKIGDSRFLDQSVTKVQVRQLEMAAATEYLPAVAECLSKKEWNQYPFEKKRASILKMEGRFPKILRQGLWGKMNGAIQKSEGKVLCSNPKCARWCHRWTVQRKLVEEVKTYGDLVPSAYEFVASEVARRYGVSTPFDSDDSLLARSLRVRPFKNCRCHRVKLCSNSCHIYSWSKVESSQIP